MKYLLIMMCALWVSISQAQTNNLNQVRQLISSFESQKDNSLLEEALEKLSDLATSKGFQPNAASSLLNAQVRTLMLKHMEIDDPLSLSSEIKENFGQALSLDQDKAWRDPIHQSLYTAKIQMAEMGNKSYEDEDFKSAHAHYQNAVNMNSLEVAYPRYIQQDTTLMYTTAVFASLADKKAEAIAGFEELVRMDYSRKDIFDYLIRLYREENMEEKAVLMEKRKAKRYPE